MDVFEQQVKSKLKNIGKNFENKATVAVTNRQEIQKSRSKVVGEIFDPERLKGFPTGFAGLDEVVGGIKTGRCIVVGGATGMGKSLFGINVLVNLARDQGQKVCYIDLENGEQESYERMMGIWFREPQEFFDDPENIKRAYKMKEEIDDAIAYYSHEELYDMGFLDKGWGLLEALIKEHAEDGVKVFMIDPLQAVETKLDSQENQNEQGRFVRMLKDMAQSLNIAIIILHHLRKTTVGASKTLKGEEIDDLKEVTYRIPDIDDLRGSGKIADFATDVWLMVRPAADTRKEIRERIILRVAKNRTGHKKDVRLQLHEEDLTITDREVVIEYPM